MGANLERGDADVGGRQIRGHLCVRDGAGDDDAGDSLGFGPHRRQLRPVAHEHRTDVGPAPCAQLANSAHEIDGPVPAAKGAGKDRDRRRRPGKWRFPGEAGPEPLGVRAPFEAGDLSRRRLRRQNRSARRDDEVGALADAFPPASHRFDEEGAIDERLLRAGIVDDRRIHFENGSSARRGSSEDGLTAKVVVTLHDDLRL